MKPVNNQSLKYEKLLQCPFCSSSALEKLEDYFICSGCQNKYQHKNDVLDLRLDVGHDTMLDISTYDERHGVNEKSSETIYKVYEKLFLKYNATMNGKVLEIASGSGHLTYGLTNLSSFSEVHCSDISPEFIKRLRNRIGVKNLQTNAFYYLFDANSFPFLDETFNIVVGNSVLHHFERFENTLHDTFRVLKPSGVAVFGEPVLDTHVFISLMASLIRSIDANQANPIFSKSEDGILAVLEKKALIKRENLRSDRASLNEMEDKFIFPIEYMRQLATKIGYKEFACVSPGDDFDFGNMIKLAIEKVFIRSNANPDKLEEYDFVFKSLNSAYAEPMREDLKRLFSFFVFVK